MANLIIKPQNTSGDKVIIQDQAGGAVLTTADSGATMASTVTGIPAAGVTGVLPVGVTGGSGLTALGTVASGNLSNSAIVYPVGHQLQFASSYLNSTASSTSTSFVNSGLNASITPLSTSNKIVIHYSGQQYISGNDAHMYSTLYRGSTHLGPSNEGMVLWSSGASSTGRWKSVSILWTETAVAGVNTFHVYFRVNNSTGYFNYGSSYVSSLTLMEIKG